MTHWQQRLPSMATLIPFEAALRHHNFTRAAEELHYSQATVSRRIGQLERELDIVLFERGRHDVTPTPEAEMLGQALAQAFGDVASAVAAVRRTATRQDTLTVYSDISLAMTLIAPVLADFRRERPDLQVRVLSSFEPITVTTEEFDVGVQYGRDDHSAHLAEPIAHDQVFPVCSPDLAKTLPTTLTVGDLQELPLLHVDYEEPAWTDWHQFMAFVDAEAPAAVERLTFTSYAVCLDVAEQGDGIALGWERTVQPRLDAGRLVRLPGLTMPRPDAICAYRPAVRPTNPHVDDFLRLLRERLNSPDSLPIDA